MSDFHTAPTRSGLLRRSSMSISPNWAIEWLNGCDSQVARKLATRLLWVRQHSARFTSSARFSSLDIFVLGDWSHQLESINKTAEMFCTKTLSLRRAVAIGCALDSRLGDIGRSPVNRINVKLKAWRSWQDLRSSSLVFSHASSCVS